MTVVNGPSFRQGVRPVPNCDVANLYKTGLTQADLQILRYAAMQTSQGLNGS